MVLVMLMLGNGVVNTAQSREPDRVAALKMLALLNAWRLDKGRAPLKANETLERLALYQANYLMSLNQIKTAEIHKGRNGEDVTTRARYREFAWDEYASGLVQVTEIAAVNSQQNSLSFWRGSSVHREAALNEAYREVGIVAIPHRFGYVYIVVLGSRPNVLPVQIHPYTGELYLTAELSGYATKNAGFIRQPSRVRLLSMEQDPLTEWFAWQPTMPMPADYGNQFIVEYSDGRVTAQWAFDYLNDTMVIDAYIPPEPTATATSTPPEPTPTAVEPEFVATDELNPVVVVTDVPPTVEAGELLILYDAGSLTITNQSSKTLDIAKLVLVGHGGSLPVSWWEAVSPVNPFKPGDCVLAWVPEITFAKPAKPAACFTNLRAERSRLTSGDRFWLEDFEVRLNDRVIGSCLGSAGQCVIDLP